MGVDELVQASGVDFDVKRGDLLQMRIALSSMRYAMTGNWGYLEWGWWEWRE